MFILIVFAGERHGVQVLIYFSFIKRVKIYIQFCEVVGMLYLFRPEIDSDFFV